MTEMKHTPWTASPHQWPEQIGCCPLVGRPYSVCGTDDRNVAAAVSLEIAHQIAALPELMAAAKSALHYMRLHKYADQSWADDLEAAIAKAEGLHP